MKKLIFATVLGLVTAGCMSLDERLASSDPKIKYDAEMELVRRSMFRGEAARVDAISRVSDSRILTPIAIDASGAMLPDGMAAVEKLSDQKSLEKIATSAKSLEVALKAVAKIKEERSLQNVTLATTHEQVALEALSRLEISDKAAEVVIRKSGFYSVRTAAWNRISDPQRKFDAKSILRQANAKYVEKESQAAYDNIMRILPKSKKNPAALSMVTSEVRKIRKGELLCKLLEECRGYYYWRSDKEKYENYAPNVVEELTKGGLLVNQMAESCGDPELIKKFFLCGQYGYERNMMAVVKLLGKIKDDDFFLDLLTLWPEEVIKELTPELKMHFLKGLRETNDYPAIGVALESFADETELSRLASDAQSSFVWRRIVNKLNSDETLSYVVLNAKKYSARVYALEKIKSIDVFIQHAKNSDLIKEARDAYCSSELIQIFKRIPQERIAEVYKANPEWMYLRKGECLKVVDSDTALFVLENFLKRNPRGASDIDDEYLNPRRIVELFTECVKKLSPEDMDRFYAEASARREEAKKKMRVICQFYPTMPVLDFIVTSVHDGYGDWPQYEPLQLDKVCGDDWRMKWLTTSILMSSDTAHKILKAMRCDSFSHSRRSVEDLVRRYIGVEADPDDVHFTENSWYYDSEKDHIRIRAYDKGGVKIHYLD